MKLEQRKLSEIKPYENNPRKNDAAVAAVVESIRQCGYVSPIVVDEDGVILAGHTRYKALRRLRRKTADVVIVPGLSDEQKRKFRILDNKTGEIAEWDELLLRVELEGLDFGDFDFGITVSDAETVTVSSYERRKSAGAEDVPNSDTDEEDDSEEATAHRSPAASDGPRWKRGDVIRLGRHRLMCGDAYSGDVDTLLSGATPDGVFTDPPYGIRVVADDGHIGVSSSNATRGIYPAIIGDDSPFDPRPILSRFGGSKILLWGANYYASRLPDSGKWLVWDKVRPVDSSFSDCELCWTNLDGVAVRKYECLWHGMIREGESGPRVHPAQKPVKLTRDILSDYFESGNLIVDIFGGSGTTLLACEELGMTCYMMEISPQYVGMIVRRWEDLTGEKAESVE